MDPHGLSVRIMQSYSNFTVGGSVSVNCHGRYIGKGPLVNSVRAVQMVRAEGQVLEMTPESALFRGLFGGYGGLGVATEVELDLDTRIRRVVEKLDLDRYPDHFRSKIARDPDVVLHNADLRPPGFAEPRPINWISTEEPATVPQRLIPRDRDYGRNQALIWAVSELPAGRGCVAASRTGCLSARLRYGVTTRPVSTPTRWNLEPVSFPPTSSRSTSSLSGNSRLSRAHWRTCCNADGSMR